MSMTKNTWALGIVALLAAAGAASASSIVANGGFESGAGTDSDQWNQIASGGPGTVSDRSTVMPLTGVHSHLLNASGISGIGSVASLFQNSIADAGMASLAPLTTVTVSLNAKVNLGPGGVAFYALRVLNSDGVIVADSGLQGLASSNGYVAYNAAVNVPAFGAFPNDTYASFIEIFVAAGAFEGSSAQAFIDDVQIDGTLVPAPGALALVGLAGIPAVSRRRRA